MSTSSGGGGMPRHMSMRPWSTTARRWLTGRPQSSLTSTASPGKADRERQLADREAQKAEAARREASAGLEELPPDCRCPYRYPEPFR